MAKAVGALRRCSIVLCNLHNCIASRMPPVSLAPFLYRFSALLSIRYCSNCSHKLMLAQKFGSLDCSAEGTRGAVGWGVMQRSADASAFLVALRSHAKNRRKSLEQNNVFKLKSQLTTALLDFLVPLDSERWFSIAIALLQAHGAPVSGPE